jgi:TRAP-type C4-dicarboxylate transport system substrate-binding protein
MYRRTLLQLIGGTTLAAGLGGARPTFAAESTLKIGTVFPKSSPWGKVLETWTKAVNQKSGGRMTLQIFYNGIQGDEDALVAKIKSGQLSGALVTGVGLGKVYKPILALQMPGLFSSWAKLDKARDAMKSEFEKGASDAGFFLAGWGDVGQVRMLSKGFVLKQPDDLKGKKPFHLRADTINPALYSTIGGISALPLNTQEVLPQLNTGAIDTVLAPCLSSEQLQWSSKVDHISDLPVAHHLCGLVFSSQQLDALPADLRNILLDTAKVLGSALTTKIRSEDDAAFSRAKGKMTLSTLSDDDKAKWSAIFKQTRQKLAQGTFSQDLVAKLESLGQ